jgi:hypothetical protein
MHPSAAATAPVPSVLVIGAGLLLLGSVLAMSAPLPFYARSRPAMERGSRIASFAGAVAALVGVRESAGSYDRGAVAITLLTVIVVMLGLLAAPFTAWIFGLFEERFAARITNAIDGGSPNHDNSDQGSAQVVCGGADEHVDEERAPRDGAQDQNIAQPLTEARKRRRWSLYVAWRHE